ncbi:MAG: hypothetical protein BWY87_00251 [Deltaproteobacteria bacterium ADurb.Bin510]|nr:MAG: hypothetical protein BWY87_00251 [Deltaproteobacteria bacterium ADurb.Bin510]
MADLELQGLFGPAPAQVGAAGELLPGHLARACEAGRGQAGHRHGLEAPGEGVHGQHAPGVGRGGVPVAALQAVQRPAHQARDVGLPGLIGHEADDCAQAVLVAADHQPPQLVAGFAREAHGGAAHGQACAQNLERRVQVQVAVGQLGVARQDVDQVEYRAGRPVGRPEVDRAQLFSRDRPVARDGLQGRELAQARVGGFDRAGYAQLAGDEGRQAIEQVFAQGGRQAVAGLVADAQHVGRQRVAAALHAREVLEQAASVHIAGQILDDAGPELLVVKRHAARDALLQAGVGVGAHVVAHAAQAAAQAGPQAQGDAAAAGQGACRQRHGQFERRLRAELPEQGLEGSDAHGRHHALADPDAVAAAARSAGAQVVVESGGVIGRRDLPGDLAGLPGFELDLLGLRRATQRGLELGARRHGRKAEF